MMLSGTAVNHADDGYSSIPDVEILGSLLVHSMVLIYSLDGSNVCGSSGREFD